MATENNPTNQTFFDLLNSKRLWQRKNIIFGLVVFGFWTLIALLETIQIYLRFLPEEYTVFTEGREISWIQWTLKNIPGWYVLAVSTPLIFWLGERFAFEKEKTSRWRVFFIHLVFSFIFAALYLIFEAFFSRIILGVSLDPDLVFQSFAIRMKSAFHLIVTSYWAILGAGFAFNFYRKYREREAQATKLALRSSKLETQLVKAQLYSLKMQLHPHFLFNTLHAISALIEDDPKIARDMIADLSELLRFTLDSVEKQTTSLENEIEFTKLYLDIERQRFKDKLEVSFRISPADFGISVPSFLLQPLIENAIKHGITGEKKTARIEVTASRKDDKLEISVEDNGKGFSENDLRTKKNGIGLSNTKARLEQLYGDEHGFSLQNSERGGAIVRVLIPYCFENDI
ncbi:MAG: histidine kinase [Pyrinomonadaceae bacterium]